MSATIVGVGCAKTSRPAPSDSGKQPIAVTASFPGPAVPSATTAASAAPRAPAPEAEVEVVGAGGASGASGAGNGMAVVIVMLPATGEAAGSAHPHKYKLSLTADTENATVEVDGQPMGAARVQHVYPQIKPERAVARTAPLVASVPARSPASPLVGLRGIDDVRGRPTRSHATAATTRPFGGLLPEVTLTSNGAPIID